MSRALNPRQRSPTLVNARQLATKLNFGELTDEQRRAWGAMKAAQDSWFERFRRMFA